jgi:AcrR family transcriptional regulator
VRLVGFPVEPGAVFKMNVTSSYGVTPNSGYHVLMGLRELNATRTRQHIVDAAMERFFEHGYDETTMEDIAAHADIGISTLYRYFPTKDQLGTALLGDPDLMAVTLTSRPASESLEEALGHAVLAFLTQASEQEEQAESFQRLVDENPRLQVRLLEWLMEAHQALAVAVATRRGRPNDDVSSAATAWMAVFVLQSVGEARKAGDTRQTGKIAAAIMTKLAADAPLVPRL